jgi:aspartate aminotransferase
MSRPSLVARRMADVRPSGTVALAQRAREMKAAGRDVIDLAEGELDFDTPDHIIDSAVSALRGGATRYTAVDGTPELKAAIAAKFRRDNDLDFAPSEITVGTGAKQVIYNALMCSVDPGDEVVVPTPGWVSYVDMATLCGATAVPVRCRPEAGFVIQPQDFAAVITDRTRWLILNSPNNPTGAVYGAATLSALAEVVRGHPRIAILSDDIYEHLTYGGTSFTTMAAVAPDLRDRILTVNGVSKAYAMTGWRIGYGAGPADLVAAMALLQGQSTSNPSAVSQAAAAAALSGPQDSVAAVRAALRARRDRLHGALTGVSGLDLGSPPPGSFYLFVRCSDLVGRVAPDGTRMTSDADIAAYLIASAGVVVVPGSAFGLGPWLRICYARPDAVLDDAATRIGAACSALT